MAALAILLASILGILCLRTMRYDAASYFADVALIREMKQLDARWELKVFKAEMGIETNYDSLVDPLIALDQFWVRLQAVIAKERDASRLPLSQGASAYHRAMLEKTRLIEHFKSHDSILRNSLAFLPTAAADIRRATGSGGNPAEASALARDSAGTALIDEVNITLLDSMVYAQAPSADRAAVVEADLLKLTTGIVRPAAIADSLAIFEAHVHTVLHEQPAVNALLAGIDGLPTA